MKQRSAFGACVLVFLLLASGAGAQDATEVTKASVPGVTNFAKVQSTIACAGATTPAGVAEVKKLGYRSIINLRQASEPGADVDAEAAAAKQAGIKYVHLPLNGASPDPAIVDQFLEAVAEPSAQPVFVHCASGNRAAALWMIKRIVVDGWAVEAASSEATALGLTSPALKNFALNYVETHRP
ncbi:MAG: sulfur transferase domain-containing protein [Vicinamibacterales bacterium]